METPLVFNPRAGRGRGEAHAGRAQRLLAARGVGTRLVPTDAREGAAGVVRRLADEGAPRVLVLGGDGTLSQAADGALRAATPPELGFLPGGTGNSFLLDFGLGTVEKAAARIAEGRARPLDVGVARFGGRQRAFINVLHAGFGASAASLADRRLKAFGDRGYTLAVPLALAKLRCPLTRLALDDRVVEERFAMVAVCNTIHTGGDMRIAPDARADDGLFDVIALREVGRLGLLRLFPKIFDGSHVGEERVLVARASRVRIEPAEASRLVLDGEVLGETPVAADVRPGALRLLV